MSSRAQSRRGWPLVAGAFAPSKVRIRFPAAKAESQFKGLTFDCAPARHYSGRRRMDNSTLWSSWVIRGAGRSLFVSCDGGYAGHFKEIRRRFGPMDLTLMKIGAYGETWLDVHMDPERAVETHRDLGGRVLMPVHWATFNLSYHAWDDPILRTIAEARKKNVDVITPRVGEVFTFAQPFRNVAWYEAQQRAERAGSEVARS